MISWVPVLNIDIIKLFCLLDIETPPMIINIDTGCSILDMGKSRCRQGADYSSTQQKRGHKNLILENQTVKEGVMRA